jgi:hypothetical protein
MLCFLSNADAMQINYERQVHSPYFSELKDVTPTGLAVINDYVSVKYADLGTDQKRSLCVDAKKQNFVSSSKTHYFWKLVQKLGDPLSQLSKVACAVIPMLSVNDEKVNRTLTFTTTVCAIAAVVFDKIQGYASNKIAEYENSRLILMSMMSEGNETNPQEIVNPSLVTSRAVAKTLIPQFQDIEGITPAGQNLINEYLFSAFRNMSEDQKRTICLDAAEGRFEPECSGLNCFWKFVRTVSDPAAQLSMLACAVMPMVSLKSENSVSKTLSFFTTICAIASVVLGKIYGYSVNEITEYENAWLTLQSMRETSSLFPERPALSAA